MDSFLTNICGARQDVPEWEKFASFSLRGRGVFDLPAVAEYVTLYEDKKV